MRRENAMKVKLREIRDAREVTQNKRFFEVCVDMCENLVQPAFVFGSM
jgi:hypothetical protein